MYVRLILQHARLILRHPLVPRYMYEELSECGVTPMLSGINTNKYILKPRSTWSPDVRTISLTMV